MLLVYSIKYTRGLTLSVYTYSRSCAEAPVCGSIRANTKDAYPGGCLWPRWCQFKQSDTMCKEKQTFQLVESPGYSATVFPLVSPRASSAGMEQTPPKGYLPGLQPILWGYWWRAPGMPIASKPISLTGKLASLSTRLSGVLFPASNFSIDT